MNENEIGDKMKKKLIIIITALSVIILVTILAALKFYLEQKNQEEIDNSIHGALKEFLIFKAKNYFKLLWRNV